MLSSKLNMLFSLFEKSLLFQKKKKIEDERTQMNRPLPILQIVQLHNAFGVSHTSNEFIALRYMW